MPTKTAFVTQINNNSLTFAGKSESNHWITMDAPVAVGGSDAGPRAKELLLLSLAGCTGSDVASILRKKRVHPDRFELHLTAEESEEHPKVFTSIHIEYIIYGHDINVAAVERAIDLSINNYCGVTAMLSKAMPITHSYRLEKTT
jgi:putative redox protein